MTVQNPPAFIQASSHPAEDVRRAMGGLLQQRGVIIGSSTAGDLKVTQRGAGANMSVDVAGGRIAIGGSEATYQGTYFAENRGTTNLTIATADATNPRIDLVVAKVQDAAYSGATNAWSLAVVTGTPAASPSAPSAPNNSVVLARVAVAAAASSITNANITDYRAISGFATAVGGTIICTSSTRPGSPWQGMKIFETDTGQELIWTGSAWLTTAWTGARTAFTPQIDQGASTNIAKTTSVSEYQIVDGIVDWWFKLNITAAGTAGSVVTLTTPTLSLGQARHCGAGMIYDSSANTLDSVSFELGSTSTVAFMCSRGTNNLWGATPNLALGSGDSIRGHCRYVKG